MKNGFKYSVMLTAFVISSLGFAKNEIPGWHVPKKNELPDQWRSSDSSRFTSVVGDFNGNKKKDQAMILISDDGKEFGIFVWWDSDKKSKPIEIIKEKDIKLLHSMGISLYKRGKTKTACGKGYFECSNNEAENITLKNDSINYFKSESSNSVFYWDDVSKSFLRTWISD